MIPVVLAQNKIKQYEYWLDDHVTGRKTVSITPVAMLDLNTNIQIDGLTPGLHTLNIRFVDTGNNYSQIITKTIDAFASNPQISAYEYWYDNDYINKTTVQLTPSKIVDVKNLDLSAMPEGMHGFNIRFRDLSSKWGAIQNNNVFKSKGSNKTKNGLTGYRYWIDNNFANNKYTALNENTANTNFMESIDMTSYPVSSNHQLCIQFLDAYGLWSSVQSTFFKNSGGGTLLFNAVSGYRYWIDGNFSNSIFREINPAYASVSIDESIDLKEFKGNNRKLYIQFKDALGLWSSVTTDTVHVNNNVGFENIYTEGILKIYPNPNRGEFTLSVENQITDVEISVSNTIGEIIFKKQTDIFDTYKIHLTNIQPGIYFVQISDSKNNKLISTAKIMIKN